MDNRLPHNSREGILYGCIIAGISSFLIGGYNVFDIRGYSIDRFGEFLMDYVVIWPAIFLIAFVLAAFFVERIAGMVVGRFAAPGDSVNARLAMNTIVCVLMMSAILSFAGGLAGESVGFLMGGPSVDVTGLADNWPKVWPRNFCIAFWVEMLVAQPAARAVMVRMHAPHVRQSAGPAEED